MHGAFDEDQYQESGESMNEDNFKMVDGRANYIITEEEDEDDTDTGPTVYNLVRGSTKSVYKLI